MESTLNGGRPSRATFLFALLLASIGAGIYFLFFAQPKQEPVETPEIVIIGELINSTPQPTLSDIAPYDEALVVYEWQVKKVVNGELESDKVRVAHWAFLEEKQQKPVAKDGDQTEFTIVPIESVPGLQSVTKVDTLPLDLKSPLYLDLSQSLSTDITPGPIRSDYRGNISKRMRSFWFLRDQLRLVVLGNSHALAGVNTRMFYLPENETTPQALNISSPGCEMAMQCLMAEEYAANLPNLEWVIWGTSPRIFNGRNAFDRKLEIFNASPGRKYDVKNRKTLWQPDKQTEPTIFTVSDHKKQLGFKDCWGWADYKKRSLPTPITNEAKEEMLGQCAYDRFKEDEELWAQFEASLTTVTNKGINVLLFTPPFHPVVAEATNADPDGTGHEAYKNIVARLNSIAESNPRVVFKDIHQGGKHEFGDSMFADIDHLLPSGAEKLTLILKEVIEGQKQ